MLVQRRIPMTDFDRFFSPVGVESTERTNDVKPRVRVSDIDWSKSIHEIDQQLYKKYKLSKDEIEFIEKMIKPMKG